jgi:high-affinity K+ transport system ATPase subunit B
MITGDHPTTAMAIGKMLGIAHDQSEVLTGKDLEGMSDEMLYEKVRRVSVYARVSPHHKLRIAQQLMKRGEIVAMTGDGVNDAPALKAAHIGIAMGKKGTDVAKEASDMVMTDDNFATIFSAVEEGRVVFDNTEGRFLSHSDRYRCHWFDHRIDSHGAPYALHTQPASLDQSGHQWFSGHCLDVRTQGDRRRRTTAQGSPRRRYVSHPD